MHKNTEKTYGAERGLEPTAKKAAGAKGAIVINPEGAGGPKGQDGGGDPSGLAGFSWPVDRGQGVQKKR